MNVHCVESKNIFCHIDADRFNLDPGPFRRDRQLVAPPTQQVKTSHEQAGLRTSSDMDCSISRSRILVYSERKARTARASFS